MSRLRRRELHSGNPNEPIWHAFIEARTQLGARAIGQQLDDDDPLFDAMLEIGNRELATQAGVPVEAIDAFENGGEPPMALAEYLGFRTSRLLH
jgi:hypothetical protein